MNQFLYSDCGVYFHFLSVYPLYALVLSAYIGKLEYNVVVNFLSQVIFVFLLCHGDQLH